MSSHGADPRDFARNTLRDLATSMRREAVYATGDYRRGLAWAITEVDLRAGRLAGGLLHSGGRDA